jgi:drug/metabolite transporter (DMT)-like permease
MFSRLSPYGQAAVMALAGYFLFSMADVSAKILSARHPVSLCLFLPGLVALFGICSRIIFERGFAGFKTPYLKLHLLRSLVISGLVVLCVNALKLIPIADFYCIIFLSPFVVMLLSVLLYKEEIHWPRILVLILSFAGVVITIGPHFDSLNIGYAFVSCAVFFSALNVFFVRRIGKDEYTPLFGFFPIMAVTVLSFPFALPNFSTLSMSNNDIGLFLFYGVVLIGAHSLLPLAFSRTPSVSRLTPLHYSQMVWGILAGIFIFNTPPEINTFIGGGLIIASGLWLFFYEHREHKNKI